jgi:RNA polymerase sigma-32 factor
VKSGWFMNSLSTELAYVTSVAGRSPALTGEQETELARRFRDSGDARAADLLVRAHLRLVIIIAVKYRHYGVPVSELVAEGNCGLLTALSKFDPERAVRFSTYAKHWVRAYVLAYALRASNAVGRRTGLVRPQLFFRLRRERARVAALLGEGAAADEALALRLNVNVDRLRRLLDSLEVRSVSLDAPAGSDHQPSLADTLVADGPDPEERFFQRQRKDAATSAVAIALQSLDARERYITERRLMAAPSEELSLAELARTLGVSRERVRQLEERAKQKLGRCPAIHRNSGLLEWFADDI